VEKRGTLGSGLRVLGKERPLGNAVPWEGVCKP